MLVWVFLYDVMENSKWIFWLTQYKRKPANHKMKNKKEKQTKKSYKINHKTEFKTLISTWGGSESHWVLSDSLQPHGLYQFSSVQFSSVDQSCPTLWDPMNCSTPGPPVHHQLPSWLTPLSIELVMPSNHIILCRPLLLPPTPPSIRVFSNESTLCMRWPKYWSFSFSISPSSEHPGPIYFRI